MKTIIKLGLIFTILTTAASATTVRYDCEKAGVGPNRSTSCTLTSLNPSLTPQEVLDSYNREHNTNYVKK